MSLCFFFYLQPRFSDTNGHFIESPLVPDVDSSTTPHFDHVTSSAPPTHMEPIHEDHPLDSTLVSSENTGVSQAHVPETSTATASLRGSKTEDLTPVVTTHTPFPARFDIPKLDFANASSTSQHISPKSALLSSSPLLHTSAVSELPPEFLQPALVEDSSTSTLILKEISALSLSSPPPALDPSLRSLPTPSMARLPGFDVTEMTSQHFASFSSSRDVDTSELGLDPTSPQHSPAKINLEHDAHLSSPNKLEASIYSSVSSRLNHSASSPVSRSSPSKVSDANHPSVGRSVQTSPLKAAIKSPAANEKTSPKRSASPRSKGSPALIKDSQHHSRSPRKNVSSTSSGKTSLPPKAKATPPQDLISTHTSEQHFQRSPARAQTEQRLSTETLPTWSSGSPLMSPTMPTPFHRDITPPPTVTLTHTGHTPGKPPGIAVAQQSEEESSPKTDAARNKLASLQAQLDAACFNAEEFLSTLKGGSAVPTTSMTATAGSTTTTADSAKLPAKVEKSPLPVGVSTTTSTLVTKLSPATSGKSTKRDNKSQVSSPSRLTKERESSTSTTKRLSAKLTSSTATPPSSKATPLSSTRTSGGGVKDSKKKPSSIPRPTKPYMTTPTAGSTVKQKAQQAPTSTAKRGVTGRQPASPVREDKRRMQQSPSKREAQHAPTSMTGRGATDRQPASPIRENKRQTLQSPAKKLSSPKKLKSSQERDQADSSEMKQRNIHLPSASSPMTGPFVSTEASSNKFTLSSLLSSHAQHTPLSLVSPPSLSTLTDSTPSASPSPQRHPPTSTAPTSSALPASHPVTPSASALPRKDTLTSTALTSSTLPTPHHPASFTTSSHQPQSSIPHPVSSTSPDMSHSPSSPTSSSSAQVSPSHSHPAHLDTLTSSVKTTATTTTVLSKPSSSPPHPFQATTSTQCPADRTQSGTSGHTDLHPSPLITTTASPSFTTRPEPIGEVLTSTSSSPTPLIHITASPLRSVQPHPVTSHPPPPHLPPAASPPSTPSHPPHLPTTAFPSPSTPSHAPHLPPPASPSLTLRPPLGLSSVDPSLLQVPDSLCFDEVCCVGVSRTGSFVVSNLGERWLQLDFKISHLYRDGTGVSCLNIPYSGKIWRIRLQNIIIGKF